MPDTVKIPSLWVPCERCGADEWEPCRHVESGKEVTYIHRERNHARAA